MEIIAVLTVIYELNIATTVIMHTNSPCIRGSVFSRMFIAIVEVVNLSTTVLLHYDHHHDRLRFIFSYHIFILVGAAELLIAITAA